MNYKLASELYAALAEGKKIQSRPVNDKTKGWRDFEPGVSKTSYPVLESMYFEWRIQPEPREVYLYVSSLGQISNEIHYSKPRARDGWTSVKFREVLEEQ